METPVWGHLRERRCGSLSDVIIAALELIKMLTGDRKRPLGTATINGFRKFRLNCRRIRWYICAGVEGLAIIRLTSSRALALVMSLDSLQRVSRGTPEADCAPGGIARSYTRNARVQHHHTCEVASMTRALCLSHLATRNQDRSRL